MTPSKTFRYTTDKRDPDTPPGGNAGPIHAFNKREGRTGTR